MLDCATAFDPPTLVLALRYGTETALQALGVTSRCETMLVPRIARPKSQIVLVEFRKRAI